MKKYTHYGVEVTRQVVDSFEKELKNNNIEYLELPINPQTMPEPDSKVVKYSKDGASRYALIVPVNRPDDYAERVYLTCQTPDDCDWKLLVEDIEVQYENGDPMQMQTRYEMISKIAEKEAFESIPYNGKNVFSSHQEPINEKELQELKQLRMAVYGY